MPTTYRRSRKREALGALHQFGAPGALTLGVLLAAATEVVTEVQKIAPPAWARWMPYALIVLAACGRAVGPVRKAVDTQRRGAGGRYTKQAEPEPSTEARTVNAALRRSGARRSIETVAEKEAAQRAAAGSPELARLVAEAGPRAAAPPTGHTERFSLRELRAMAAAAEAEHARRTAEQAAPPIAPTGESP